jgi:hypothetical protein
MVARDLFDTHHNLAVLYCNTGKNDLAHSLVEKAESMLQHMIEHQMPVSESTAEDLKRLKQWLHERIETSIPVHIPTAHRGANPVEEARRNVEFQRRLSKWKALPL